MAKYSPKLVNRIVEFIEQDIYTISEMCNLIGINRKTFYEWKKSKPEFSLEIEDAMERRDEMLVAIARSSLKKKLEGYTVTEVKETYIPSKGNPDHLILKTQVVKKKEYAPDNRCIAMVLERQEKKRLLKEKEAKQEQERENESNNSQQIKETKEDRLVRLMLEMNPTTEEHRRIVVDFNEFIEKERIKNRERLQAG